MDKQKQPDLLALGGEFRAFRTRLGLSQQDVADELGVKQESISGFERGEPKREPTFSTLLEKLETWRRTVHMPSPLRDHSQDAPPAYPASEVIEANQPKELWQWTNAANKMGRQDLVDKLVDLDEHQEALIEEWESTVQSRLSILAELQNVYQSWLKKSGKGRHVKVEPPEHGEPFS